MLSNIYLVLFCYAAAVGMFYFSLKNTSWGYTINFSFIFLLFFISFPSRFDFDMFMLLSIRLLTPLFLINVLLKEWLLKPNKDSLTKQYAFRVPLSSGSIKLKDIRRGVSIIGAAGSGKTESVVAQFLRHFSRHTFCGIIHDYKNFELSKIAYPLFKESKMPFYIISFDTIFHKVNPIAPRYMQDEESVNEISRVLLENLLEKTENGYSGSSRFFNDAAEGIIGGLIWKLKTDHPGYCTLPHLIALFQQLTTYELVDFLSSNLTSQAMANAFINGVDSERQTASVKSTLSNAFKKISTQRIFMVLSEDEIPLDINNSENPGVISVVNNPKFESAYSPIVATIIHSITKQMSVHERLGSFILMEEASTIRLLNMHRIPATLRSYNIATVYVIQDKIQNDILYGREAGKAILSNLSYQFFGKVNDPETAKYYESFFEIVKRKSISVSKSDNLNFDTRTTKSEREVAKIRADVFFRLKPGEFVTFSDGKDRKVKFSTPDWPKELPDPKHKFSLEDLELNFQKIYREAKAIYKSEKSPK
ncbi:type IV secretion system DNA-binding domain-containing protein [Salegentibacter sp. F188]|uniref:Type IV secretion system DNA-binding domain-containing protein n=1 Tax=Autumnicola patrickiae TaxID=3075591 RepID=A0ABU3DYC7_9FLAO|nr:type IV secretion system DNA-binding domain-containing protein [Salegentibacter sp. F188]MDT0688728.1 type IV secretion system DNA-binding domain-containing protein [Salegentibacter sp. F188]